MKSESPERSTVGSTITRMSCCGARADGGGFAGCWRTGTGTGTGAGAGVWVCVGATSLFDGVDGTLLTARRREDVGVEEAAGCGATASSRRAGAVIAGRETSGAAFERGAT